MKLYKISALLCDQSSSSIICRCYSLSNNATHGIKLMNAIEAITSYATMLKWLNTNRIAIPF